MKIYLTSYDSNRPTLKQVNIPNYSSAKIGIEVVKDGTKLELAKEDVKLTSGDTVLSADDVYSGYVTVPVTVGDCGDDILYKVEINKTTVGEEYSDSFKLVINSVKSSVIDAAEATEIPVATTETIGGVKVGNGLTIDDDGTLKTTGGYVEEDIILDMSKMETEGPSYYLTNLQPGKSYRIITDETTGSAIYDWNLNIEPDATAGWKIGDKCRIYFSPDDKYSDSVFQYMTFSSTLGTITYWYGNKCFKFGQCSQWRANNGFYFELTYGTIENPFNNELLWTITGGSQGGYYQE